MRFRFRVNTSALTRFIERATAAPDSAPVREGMVNASDEYMQAMRERFANGGNGDWPPLAESTVKNRERRGQVPVTPLHITGSLESSLERGAPSHVLEQTENSVIEGTAHPVAGFQHHGTERIPARSILIDPEAETLEAMKGRMVEGMKEALR